MLSAIETRPLGLAGCERGKSNKRRMLLVHLRRSGSSHRATQRTRMRDSRMSEGEKEGPARQRRTAHPRVVTGRPDRARGMRGLSSYPLN